MASQETSKPTAHDNLSDSDPGLSPRNPRNNAATGASAAGVRALSAQLVAFYFKAPIKAFFRTRVEYEIKSWPSNTTCCIMS